jgi:prepilin-type N-terminal cleavage/methylation domain-containing protein
MFSRKAGREGFTLVELSIVLVIVGLLIGGILVTQSMSASSRIVSVAAQIQQFDAGVSSFKATYNYLPGDAPGFGGDGDGLITSCCGGNLTRFMGEIGRFWYNLNPQEFQNCSGQCRAISKGNNKNVPAAKFGASNSFFISSAISTNGFSVDTIVSPGNYYVVLDSSQIQTQVSGEWQFTATSSTNPALKPSAVKPADALALDKKIDDGTANAGGVLSGRVGGGAAGAITSSPLVTCSVGGNYLTANNSYECTPLIRIGGQTGEI